jgi:two-component system, cell cycle response regulator CpdR
MARILLSEDDDAVRGFVLRALESFGHDVRAAADGGAALAALGEEPFDLLLTDIVMPVMDGIALALKASADWPDMPILMMTGYAHERQRAHNLDDLIFDVLDKPFGLAQLRAAIDRALAR